MHSDEMNKIEVRNVKKFPLFAVFYEVFFSMGNHSSYFYLLSKSNKNWTSYVKTKIDFIHGNFSIFFVVFFFYILNKLFTRVRDKICI